MEEVTCQICLENIHTAMVVLPCHPSHNFCEGCYVEWIQNQLQENQRTHISCPTCRSDILTRAEAQEKIHDIPWIKTWDQEGGRGFRTITTYLRGEKNGRYQLFAPSGCLIHEAHYENGILHGISRHWYESGKMKCETEYISGIQHGPMQAWDENGILLP